MSSLPAPLDAEQQAARTWFESLRDRICAEFEAVEREAGSDAAAMKTRARLEGDSWVLNGTKAWITNSGVSEWYTVMAVTDPAKGANGISAFMVHKDDPGFTVGPLEKKLGIKGSPTAELYFEDCTIPLDRIIGDDETVSLDPKHGVRRFSSVPKANFG